MSAKGIRADRRVEAVLLLLAGIAFGACREFAFINLNYQIDHLARHTPFSFAHSMVQGWTSGWDLRTLTLLKSAMALGSMAVMAGLCILLARVLFGTWRHALPIALAFAGFALAALLAHLLSPWAGPLELVSVRLAHMLQYPVPLLFVLLAATLPRTDGTGSGHRARP